MSAPRPTLVFVHSPLVSPGSWTPTAEVMSARGWTCHVPTVPDDTPWSEWAAAVAGSLADCEGALVVGHSASNLLLPDIAARLDGSGMLFVDGNLPPDSGATPPAEPEFWDFVKSLPLEGERLPRWSDWWGPGALTGIFPDPDDFAAFEAALPELPIRWFEDEAPVPEWSHLPAAYLQTSPRLAAVADVALKRGWPVGVQIGTHLHPMLAPDETANAIEGLIAEMLGG